MANNCILKCEGIYKSFASTRALVDVSIEVNCGEIRGLIGENGSGKSTLCSIIAGAQKGDKGNMQLSEQEYTPASMVAAQEQGISMIVQEMGTIPGISVASNIFLGKLGLFTKGGIFNPAAMNKKAKEILAQVGVPEIDPSAMIDTLNFEDRKIVEIARAMYTSPRLLIIDETTTALAAKGRGILYSIIKKQQQENRAVLFISHDLDELMEVCSHITVLRDGVIITTMDKEQMNIGSMRRHMVGRELTDNYYRADYDGSYSDEVVLELRQVTNETIIENFDLQLHKGEILGIGGLSDCGMHEIGRLLFGIDKPITGEVVLSASGTRVKNPSVAINQRMGYVSKDRDKEALILNAPIMDNIVLPSLRKMKKLGVFIPRKSERELAEEERHVMEIKCRSIRQNVQELSGGNKQKVVFGRWLGNGSEIFVLDCPTRGIDVGVKANMYQLMYRLKQEGKSIIMISEELPELIGMSDRMLIMKAGKVTKEFTRSSCLSEHEIIEHMI